ncbi:PKD domain-containing protein [Carboxylicivirga caseinilyticus]|uniref:PKD domain-containing protein n=1 Tax=Carboxylicivirga caseinilyticus TaxID=3417572 RepID=UPI003D345963|nr:PKD domain-containing protein [Marinilabiliaceae bacterium A049]
MRYILLLAISTILIKTSNAQNIIDFSSDIQKGCSPIIISFNNLSTYPEGTTYFWDFGNGNTSTEINPQTTYSIFGTYTISLSATYNDITETIVKNNYLLVYAQPEVDIEVIGNNRGCVPLKVNMQPNNINGANINQYTWSFGDGNISADEITEHTYAIQGDFSITLLVEDDNGCTGSVTKENFIQSFKPVAKFGADKTYSCNGEIEVNFNNLSESILNFSSIWSFGDNEQSDLNSPFHKYNNKGLYDVALKITDELGCSDSIDVSELIRIEKVKASFSTNKDTICINEPLAFINTSSDANQYKWTFSDGTQLNNKDVTKAFNNYGNVTVTLTAENNNCKSDTSTIINIEYVEADFIPIDTFLCEANQNLRYFDRSVNAVEWNWKFGNGVTSNSPNPQIYIESSKILEENYFITYSDTLEVKSKHNCKSKKIANNNIKIRIPEIILDNSNLTGCVPFETNLHANVHYDTPNDHIKSVQWLVNNIVVSDNENYTHYQSDIGNQKIIYQVETNLGCLHTSELTVSAGEQLTPYFTIQPEGPVCASEVVMLSGKVEEPDKKYNVSWDLGDGSVILPADIIPHQFEDTGYMDITFEVINFGCKSSITKTNAIYINGPYIDLSLVNDCNLPLDYKFLGEIKGADHFTWDFGDGSGVLENTNSPSHSYSVSGDYIVEINASNNTNGCTFLTRRSIKARDLRADFNITTDKRCPKNPIVFDGRITKDNFPFKQNNITTNYLYLIDNKELITDTTLTYSFNNKGAHTVSLIVHDINQCIDTLTKTVQIFKPEVNFESNYKLGCMPVTFSFNDQSVSDTLLTSWQWNFGDGQTSEEPSPDHEYDSFGNYNVSLTVQDAEGCISTLKKNEDIQAIFPDASFIADDTTGCVSQDITLSENTTSIISSYKWFLNEEILSEIAQPTLNFNDSGYYTIRLDIIDEHGCEASKTKENYIHIQEPPQTYFESSSTYSDCYPFLVKFQDKSVTDYPGSWYWLFNQESNKSIVQNPSFIYSKPGKYDVTLISSTTYGCSDTLVRKNYIEVKGPYAKPVVNDTICINSPVTLSAIDTSDIYKIAWDLGDGNIINNLNAIHTYKTAGELYPSLIIQSDSIGTCNVIIRDTIRAIDFKADFLTDLLPESGCIPLEINLNNQSINAGNIIWLINDTLQTENSTYSFTIDESGLNTIQLIAQNTKYGCIDTSDIKTIVAYPPPTITTSNDTLICVGDQIIINAYGGIKYLWEPSSSLDDETINNPLAQPDSSTLYKVLVTDIHQCSAIDSLFITVQQIPTLSIPDTTIIIGETVFIQISHDGLLSAEWELMDGINCTNCFNNEFKPLETTEYKVWITDTSSCFTVDYSYLINVEKKYSIDLPSAFTPNGDGINDLLFVRGWGLEKLIEFKIFNRFGELVYQSVNIDQGWDGTYKGKILPNETYQYIVKAVTYNNEIISKSGNIKIIH